MRVEGGAEFGGHDVEEPSKSSLGVTSTMIPVPCPLIRRVHVRPNSGDGVFMIEAPRCSPFGDDFHYAAAFDSRL